MNHKEAMDYANKIDRESSRVVQPSLSALNLALCYIQLRGEFAQLADHADVCTFDMFEQICPGCRCKRQSTDKPESSPARP